MLLLSNQGSEKRGGGGSTKPTWVCVGILGFDLGKGKQQDLQKWQPEVDTFSLKVLYDVINSNSRS